MLLYVHRSEVAYKLGKGKIAKQNKAIRPYLLAFPLALCSLDAFKAQFDWLLLSYLVITTAQG